MVSRFITTPLLLLDLCLTAGLPWPTILWTIGLDEAMIITGLLGALVKSRYKWGECLFAHTFAKSPADKYFQASSSLVASQCLASSGSSQSLAELVQRVWAAMFIACT